LAFPVGLKTIPSATITEQVSRLKFQDVVFFLDFYADVTDKLILFQATEQNIKTEIQASQMMTMAEEVTKSCY
jgi:hypothetical protein